MRRLRTFAALWLGIVVSVPALATQWPGGAKAAVVLTYDDSLDSQLDHAVPALNAAGLKGTFFLSNIKRRQVERWRIVARRGHELANHSLFHPCAAATYPADPRYTTESYTPASMIREIEEEEAFLSAIDGHQGHGYGTPCGQTVAGGKDYLGPLAAAGFVSYIRQGDASAADLAVDPSRIDRMLVPSRAFPETVTAADLIAHAQTAEAGGGLAVYVFHGVGGDYLKTPDAVHRAFVAWLATHRRDIWVATMSEALTWAQAHPGRPMQ